MKAIRTIGFTGTIASGKSTRCKRLVEVAKEYQNAFVTTAEAAQRIDNKATPNTAASAADLRSSVMVHYINADLVGHNIYEPGKPCYRDLINHFGSVILPRTPQQQQQQQQRQQDASAAAKEAASSPLQHPPIDRRVLGDIVFADERKLQELNAICWPYICAAIRAEHAAVCARATGNPLPAGIDTRDLPPLPAGPPAAVAVIIVEAALLCEMTDVLSLTTDLWMTHCTPVTAVDRLITRNGLSREAAERRVSSQREVGQKLQALRELSYKGDIEVFDTTQVALAAGLKETERAFEKFWQKKVLTHLS